MSQDNQLKIRILDQEYQVNCPEEQRKDLQAAANHLHEKMQTIKDEGKIIDAEKIAIMAALNISFDLLKQASPENSDHSSNHTHIRRLNNKVDDALNRLLQLEI